MSRAYRKPRETKPTTTTLVVQALAKADDFLALIQLVEITGRTSNQVSAALRWLRNRHAVDSVESGGRLWWMNTPAEDDRSKVLATITVEQIVKTRRRRNPVTNS